jgi:coiled-coil and C2 domain-containing protein 1
LYGINLAPGFAPIPGHGEPVVAVSAATIDPSDLPRTGLVVQPNQPQPEMSALTPDSSSPEKKVKPSPPSSSGVSSGGTAGTSTGGSLINRGGKPGTKLTLQEKQLTLMLERQKEYRDAAVQAKKRGDINQAREYLRISKGFDNLIEASKSGLPVELSSVISKELLICILH